MQDQGLQSARSKPQAAEMRSAHEKEKMSHKAALLADALSVPFNPDKLSEDFSLDVLSTRLACIWAGAQGVARECGSGFPGTYTLVGDDPTLLAVAFADAILLCETKMRLAAKE